jgi:hypothetical protein
MALGVNVALRNAEMQVIADAVDAGGAAGVIRIYGGTRPATGGAETTILAELTLTYPGAFLAPDNGAIQADTINPDTSANNTGTATWFRFQDSAGAHVLDGDVGTSGSDLNLNTTSITQGVQVDITSVILTAGNA